MKKIILLTLLGLTSLTAADNCSDYLKEADLSIIKLKNTDVFSALNAYSNMSIMYMKRYDICIELKNKKEQEEKEKQLKEYRMKSIKFIEKSYNEFNEKLQKKIKAL